MNDKENLRKTLNPHDKAALPQMERIRLVCDHQSTARPLPRHLQLDDSPYTIDLCPNCTQQLFAGFAVQVFGPSRKPYTYDPGLVVRGGYAS